MRMPHQPLRIQRHVSAAQRALERQQLEKFAARVVDEQHWEDVLASCPTPETRAELERVIGPMLAFRRAAPCTTPECTSGDIGLFQPVLEVRNPITPDDVAWVPIERLRLCQTCYAQARVQDFLTDDIWQQILLAWDPSAFPPVRRLTTLTFDRVH
jgi:hypothetical protein